MAEQPSEPTSIEAMAFQVVLQRLESGQEEVLEVKRALQQVLRLLTKVVTLLEAQTKQPAVPVATWEELYPELRTEESVTAEVVEQPEPPRRFLGSRWLARWCVEERPNAHE